MSKKIQVKEFLELSENIPVIDVRSPKEFEQGHIPGAYNIPLFSNEERAIVGTDYKQKDKETAIYSGLEIVGSKLVAIVKRAKEIAKDNNLLVHCWRGGMRSASMAWLFETIGLKTQLLEGGYKAYRRYFKEKLSENQNIVILGGLTGSGKTEVLLEMQIQGEQIIDLEGIANHKGSAYGAIGQLKQPTNEQFENNLGYEWLKLNLNKTIWLEDESKAIGADRIPDELYLKMKNATVINMQIDKDVRIKRLMKEYTDFEKDILIQATNRIAKRLGGLNTKEAIESIESGDLKKAVDISLIYYDKAYSHGLNNREKHTVKSIHFNEDKPKENAKEIIKFYKSL
ncbi:MAG: tRNA 2-selenouridine(34) synthase MnmH [Bacteroidota bacterium]|nr:tRNA 2-selenouridine(34) synthase MnmH [Bacteroidota bacterium]